MKNLNIKDKFKIMLGTGVLSFSLIITGCSSKSHNANTDVIPETSIEQTINTDVIPETSLEQTTTPSESAVTESSQANNQQEENFDNFESEKENLDSLIYTDNFELVDEVWSEYFIDAIDFIFYDKEYKDTKFSELNPEAQQKVIENIKSMGNTMNKLFPNWKDNLKDIKGAAIDFYYGALDEIEDLIGEEKYDKITDFKNGIKEEAKELGGALKDKVEEWYQEYKANHSK